MKKLLTLMLAAALALSLVACGGSGGTGDNSTPSTGNGDTTSTDTPSAEKLTYAEMIEKSTVMSASELKLANDNAVKMQQLIGSSYIISGEVWSVELDYCIIRPIITEIENGQKATYEWGNMLYFHAYMPTEELATLRGGQEITVVGTLAETYSEDRPFEGTSFPVNILIMENAYQLTKEDRLKFLFGYDGSPEAVMEMALNFGNDGDSNVSWTENSFPYFIDMRSVFTGMSDTEIERVIVGSWSTVESLDNVGDTREYIFMDDGTGKKQKYRNDTEEEYAPFYWSANGGLNYSPYSDRVTANWSMCQASDDVLVGYDATGKPRMIFIKN